MNEIKYDFTNNQTFNENLNIDLTRENNSVDISGPILLWGDTSSSLVLNINHIDSNTRSHVKLRVILRDSAKLNITGALHIQKQADNCDAYFEVKVLLLGDKAKATVVPELKIDNKNVTARHAVVIKKISEDDLYFLGSRGIELSQAKKLISEGFLNL